MSSFLDVRRGAAQNLMSTHHMPTACSDTRSGHDKNSALKQGLGWCIVAKSQITMIESVPLVPRTLVAVKFGLLRLRPPEPMVPRYWTT